MLSPRWGKPCRFQGACAAHPVLPLRGVYRLEADVYQTFLIVSRWTEIVVKECHRPFPGNL
ncbi:hypothetical protein BCEN4_250003 [Burkholderia cenocepacia]|nr:hypothetical protein BCEN4_250003 [Burkholderia cenocepacia]